MWFRAQPPQPLIGLSVCAVAGITVAEFSSADPTLAALPVALLAMAAWYWPGVLPFFVFAGFFLLHTIQPQEHGGRRLAEQLSFQPRTIHVVGVVVDEPRAQGTTPRGQVRADFPVRTERVSIDGRTEPCSALLYTRWLGPAPTYGDRVELTGNASNLEPVRNPGQYDFAGAMRRRGIFSEVRVRYAKDAQIVANGCGNSLRSLAMRTRLWMERTLSLGLEDEPENASLIRGMVLGSHSDTPPEIEDLFRKTGTIHLFAVSGLNVAMFAYIAWGVLKTCGVRRRIATPPLIALVVFYALLTGLSASGVRAAVMTSVLLGGFLADRPALPLNSLAAAACAILLWDTNQLFAPGFQLSFSVVVAIFVFANPIRRHAEKITAPDPFLPRRLFSLPQRAGVAGGTFMAEAAGVSIAAWFGSLLLNLHYFHLISPWTVTANLLVVPLAFFVLAIGTLSLLSASSAWLVAVFNNANLGVTWLIVALVRFFANLPGSSYYVEWPQFQARPLCALTVLDMKNGGAIHLRADGSDWMIDCANDRQYRWTTRSYLREQGVNQLAGLILSHGDIEHIGAASSLFEDFQPRMVVDSILRDRSSSRRNLQIQLAAVPFGRCLAMRDDVIPIGRDVHLRILYPAGGVHPRIADDKALVCQLVAGRTRILFTSDSGFYTERWLLDHERDLRSDVLVKGQHVSDLSGTMEFLHAVAPRLIICSAASFPKQARPSPEWVSDVAARGIRLFRQDETGAVMVRIDQDGFAARSFLGDQTFRSLSR